jgi:hypothetical protein
MKRREMKFVHESPRLSPGGIDALPPPPREMPGPGGKGRVPRTQKQAPKAGVRRSAPRKAV